MREERRGRACFLAALVLLAGATALSLMVGRYPITWQGLWNDPYVAHVFVTLRLGRTGMVLLAGFALGVAGSVYQTVFRNPLAAPDIIGVASGASAGAAAGILLFGGGSVLTALWAFGGGFAAVLAALALSAAARERGIANLVLSGIVVNALAQAVLMLMKLTADPENGLQALFRSARFDADAWIDWKDFIFKDDDHQERFVVALSSDIKLNDPQKPLHWHIPLQIVGQHIGGEVQADEHHGISSIANVAAGIGLTWNARRGVLKSISAESHFVGYKQLSGSSLPINDGYGWHNAVSARLGDFFVKAGHMNSRKFVSILGSPYFGSLTESAEPTVFEHSQMVYGKIEYSKRLKDIASLGINLTLYQYFSGNGVDADGERISSQSSASIVAGIYLRVSPSLFLHRF